MRKHMSRKVCLSLIVVLFSIFSAADAAEPANSYALLVQQSPVEGGTVSPGTGVHKIEIGQTVSLTAVPRPGYRFLYWLGDVAASGTVDTTIQVDSPKMVVAVFTREAYEEELPGVQLIKGTYGGGGGGGRLIGTPMFSTGGANPGSYYDPGDLIINYPPFEPEAEEEPPVQLDEGETWVPGENPQEVPEPATLLLLGMGALTLFKKNRT